MQRNIHSVLHRGKYSRFIVDNKDDLIQSCFIRGHFFDIEELDDYSRYIPANATILDIGANVGNHTVYYATHTSPRKVIPFEINPPAYELLLKNIALNQLDVVDLSFLGTGLASSPGKVFMRHSRENNLGASSFSTFPQNSSTFPTNSLDNLLSSGEKIDFLKIDVEGMELDVLRGGQRIFLENRPIVFLENFGWGATLKLTGWLVNNHYYIEKKYGPNYLLLPHTKKNYYPESCLTDFSEKAIDGIAGMAQDDALKATNSLYQKYSDNFFLAYALAEVFLKFEKYTTALKIFKRLEKMHPIPAKPISLYQSISENATDPYLLIEVLQKANNMAPADSAIMARLVEIYQSTTEQTIKNFLEKNPESATGWHMASILAQKQGDWLKTLQHAKKATELCSSQRHNYMIRWADLTRNYGSVTEAHRIINNAFALGNISDWGMLVKKQIEHDLCPFRSKILSIFRNIYRHIRN